MDFDDLLVKCRDLLRNHPYIRKKVAARHLHVMVDEYQDTNSIQAELTELFGSVHQNIMAVGDDAQSIYSFRGADPKNMLQFPERFTGTRVIKLEENYRSSKHILALANRILNLATHNLKKTSIPGKRRESFPDW